MFSEHDRAEQNSQFDELARPGVCLGKGPSRRLWRSWVLTDGDERIHSTKADISRCKFGHWGKSVATVAFLGLATRVQPHMRRDCALAPTRRARCTGC